MLTVLGGLAEFEREQIRARTGEGRKRAKARGVKFGRPTALTPQQRQEALRRLAQGEAQADIARSYAVSQATISRLADVMRLSIILIYRKPLCLLAYRLKLRNERIVRLDRGLNRSIVGRSEANALQ